jgi:pSer/pThr/pTyr-binding forkhead associated (FHA) protein
MGAGPSQVRVNAVPLAAGVPYFIQPGDKIYLGEMQLTWTDEAAEPAAQPHAEPPVRVDVSHAFQPKPAPAAPRNPVVVVVTPQGSQEYPLTGEIIRLGRAVENDISIDDKMVSRYHAQLLRKGNSYEIIDLGSVNGLSFQNIRFSKRLLTDGDVIGISRTITLTFHGVGAPVTPPPASEPPVPQATIIAAGKPPAVPAAPPAEEPAAPATILSAQKPAPPPTEEAPPETVTVAKKAAASPPAPPEEAAAPETIVVPKKTPDAPPAAATMIAKKKASGPQPAVPAELPGQPGDALPPPPETVVVPKIAPAPSQPPPEPPQKSTEPPPTVVTAPRPAIPEQPEGLGETAAVDMAAIVAGGFDQKYVPSLPPRNTEEPYLVVHLPDRTWEVDFTVDPLTIGRTEENTLQIQDESISRSHARIEKRGDGFIIRDLNSRNGVWLGRQRIDQHRLRDGDVISLGKAKLIFKGGFRLDDLTLIGTPRIDGKPARRPVVFVPGFGGSELYLGSEKLWPVPKLMISNPEILRLPGDPRIEARNIVSDVVIIPGIMKQEQYSRLGDYLESGLGYKRGKDLFEFAYDWRQDIRINSQRLAQTIEAWGIRSPITIIAHSLGTLVSRYYVEKFGGRDKVERLALMGGPHYGTPRGLAIITTGPGVLPFGFGDERMRKVLNTMTSSYQILPIYPCVFDQLGRQVDLLEDESWLPEEQRHFLGEARSFRRELGFQSSVPAVSIFGYGLKTVLRVKVTRRSDGSWEKIEPVDELGGDLTVPAGSSVLQNSEIHPVMQEHGSLYVDNDVKMRLKVELTRSTTLQRRK